jgi:UDP-N-acetylglucosamine--N-acetylmuramyl-(pentapeptide) pyrophosphoryl-undecaprenol N-acetylglucosamine transferase
MARSRYLFAGGGTGGHIYPALAVAEQIRKTDGDAQITFLCSGRAIDSRILSKTEFEFIPLPMKPFSVRPDKLIVFCMAFLRSYQIAKERINAFRDSTIVVGVGGFASAPVVFAAGRLHVPVAMLNVDIVPGRANKLLAGFAKEIFVQFAETAKDFAKTGAVVSVTGCPLREGFVHPDKHKAINGLGLDKDKNTLVVTGASSGSMSINSAVCRLLTDLEEFREDWQVVHLTGRANYEQVHDGYANTKIPHKVLDYYDDMASLLAVADLVVGRAGAVSVAEYAASGVAAICMPYPYHKDRHQYSNAGKLVEAGAAVVVEDVPRDCEQTSKNLSGQLIPLMKDRERLRQMGQSGRTLAKLDAAERVAAKVISMS